MKRLLPFLFLLCPFLLHAEPAASVLTNGDFESGSEGWPLNEGASIQSEDSGNHFLRLEFSEPSRLLSVYRSFPIDSSHQAFVFSFRARYDNIVHGKEQWHDGRIILDFKDAGGKRLASPSPPYFKKTSKGWIEKTLEFTVPAGAVRLEIMPALFNVKAGTFDLDDLTLTPADPAPIIARREAHIAERAADTARRAAAVKPTIPAPPADKMPPALRVVGNQIQTDTGTTVWLQGLAIPSLEWVSNGENILKSTEIALTEWKANCIRLPVRDNFWTGKGPYQKDGGAGYRQLIEDVANLCATHGAYLVLDLHRFRAPEEAHVAFWKDAATRFKNHPAVLFELFNEPHDLSWDVWKKGGFVTDEKSNATIVAENGEKLRGFQSVGMQRLLDTIRETGAQNIVIVGGLDWGYDLSGILNGHALDDRGGRGIVYSTHVYPWKSAWQGKFLALADKYPLFIGELGGEEKPMAFLRPDQHEDPYTWSPDMLGLIQKYKFHWTGWSFHHKASPRILLSLETYEPTPYWGQFVKDALAGKQFELKKLR
ncbi:glycoside hydrolase family 5 protein [Rariglobus hedericola]|uniref:Cellulase family glycosylhydrolase n=1 Tax=Rariglobus hedericola TaxID=2597822 RepID=A0A556QSG2_9BACT|nr:cellulase family glycosylhydrolase [Rariglobus hedericola]TSJ79575.1 cellulase family glycosylhydrolase [Rariglobus hedericola]